MDLNHARLPIPPPGRCCFTCYVFAFALRFLFSSRGTRLCILFEVCKSSGVFNYFLSGPVEGASCGDGHVVPWRPVGRPIRAARPSGLVPCQPASTRGTLHQRHGKLSRASSPAIHRGRILGAWARRARRLLPRQPSPDHAADRSRAQALVRGRPGRAVFPPAQGNVCPSIKTEGEFELLRAAHARVLPLQSEGYPVCTLPRARACFFWPG